MAPEFFPLIGSFAAFVALAGSLLLTLLMGAGLLVWARYDARRRKGLLLGSALAFCGALPLAVALFVVGSYIRHEYFLNEPLVTACASGDLTQAQHLLERGASPDAESEGGMTALMYAASNGHRDLVALLLRSGADVRLHDSTGKTALEWAREAGHAEIAAMIERSRKTE